MTPDQRKRARSLDVLEELERRRRLRRAGRVTTEDVRAQQHAWRERIAALCHVKPIHPKDDP